MKPLPPVLCSALPLPDAGTAPEWLHLVPAGVARTVDGRGPYRIDDGPALCAASLAAAGGKLLLDENHATDLAAPLGLPARAVGWIVELQSRAGGIWGRVDWTPEGKSLAEGRAYRGVSPAITHDKAGVVTGILRASLTNLPNLAGLVALHSQETMMDFRKMLIELLKLDGEPDDAAISAALAAWKDKPAVDAVALQAALKPLALAAGVAETSDATTVLAGIQALKSGGDDRVAALQSSVGKLTTSLNQVTEERKRDTATAFVDAAIGAGRVGLKPVRDDYIAMHMAEPARAQKLVNAMPVLKPGATELTIAPTGEVPDNPVLLSQKAGAYQAKLAAAGTPIDFAAAVRAVAEGKTA